MAKVRYRGSEPADVPLLGRTVDPDEVVVVPDDVFESREWPETNWTVVSTAKKTAKDGE